MAKAAAFDEGNTHSVIYLWGTNGIGYNVEKVRERLGEDAPTDTWDMIFDPEIAAKLADCGISILDSATEVMPIVLNYLGYDPGTSDQAELQAAADTLLAIRPYVRYFHSSQYISDLANGEICVSLGWSGDVFIAGDRAAEAGQGIEIAYSIPKEGTLQWFDMMAIPADAPNPEAAHQFIDFVLRPENIADVTNYVFYPNAVDASLEFVDPDDRRGSAGLSAAGSARQSVPVADARCADRAGADAALDHGPHRAVTGGVNRRNGCMPRVCILYASRTYKGVVVARG